MEYVSLENVKKTLASWGGAFEEIFGKIGEGRIDQDLIRGGVLENFKIRGMGFNEFAKIANRVKCSYADLFEDGVARDVKEGDWIYERDFFRIRFSLEEPYKLYKMRFRAVGEKGQETEVRRRVIVAGGKRGYGLKDWDKKKVLDLVEGNEKIQKFVERKIEKAEEELLKWKEARGEKDGRDE